MLRSVVVALLGAGSALAVQCTLDSHCPQDAPCCSQYGECGVGAYCLGGCDPRMSYSLDSCMPAPVCEDKVMDFKDLSSIVSINKYLGDPTQADWMSQGEALPYDGNVLLTMPSHSVGTVLASTRYMWYGNVKATMKTSHGAGVVSAFILLSDVKDEIDFEFVGVDLATAQTNYYWQGVLDYHNSGNISGLSDTLNNFHEYEIRWTPDQIQWLIDGKVGRTLRREDTWNATANRFQFPQTPARVQLSIWPGGAASNQQGTIDWAGGPIDWDSEDIQKIGYYFTTFKEVSVECYKASSGPGTNSGKGYTYDGASGLNNTIVDGNKDTVLASFEATGLDPEAGKPQPKPNKPDSSKTSSASGPKKTQAEIPGGGSGSTGDYQDGSSGSSPSNSIPGGGRPSAPGNAPGSNGDGSAGSGSRSGSDGSSSSDGDDLANCDPKSFSQSCSSSADASKSGPKSSGSRQGASSLAVLIAGFALCLL
ncbi:putative glycosidase [Escovopsis weberi]|uniref:Crh-like protein n=1 Tax=Escovopsis weberi TaxID=150374 RepID=A0A0M8N5B7_ESCWE|nr:putative glycosidase [Escovopsis weberi]